MSKRGEHEDGRTVDRGWVQGELLEVMESWPMQLLVRIGEEDITLELSPEAKITSEDGARNVLDLQPGRHLRIHIEHLPGHPSSRLTHELEVLPAER